MKKQIDIEKTLSVIKNFGLDIKTRRRDMVYLNQSFSKRNVYK